MDAGRAGPRIQLPARVFVKLDDVNLLENLGNKKVKKIESLNMNKMCEIENLEYKSLCAPSIKL